MKQMMQLKKKNYLLIKKKKFNSHVINISGNVMVVMAILLCKSIDFLSILSIIPKILSTFIFPIFNFIFFFLFTYPEKPNHLTGHRAQNANDRLSLFIFIYKILPKIQFESVRHAMPYWMRIILV